MRSIENLKKEIKSAVDIFASGDMNKAESISRELIAKYSKEVFLYNLLGLILSRQGKIDEAIEYYEKGIKINPNYAMIYNNLALLLFNHKNENFEKVENLYKKSISLDKNIPEPHNNLGTLYNSINKHHDAINCYENAIKLNNNFHYAYYNLGTVNITVGKFESAVKNLKKAIKLNPKLSNAHRALSRIINYTKNEEHLKELKKIDSEIDKKDIDGKINISFSLGKAYEDIEDFDKSYIYYDKANTFFRKTFNFSIENEKRNFNEIKRTFDKKLFKNFQNSGYKDNSPIFIVGMPRSGTTLLEQILSSHPRVFGADEMNIVPQLIHKKFGSFGQNKLNALFEFEINSNKDELRKIGEEYVNQMSMISNNSEVTTDKLPINFIYVGFIKLILPNSKIIHCSRNAKDNCLSIFKNHFSSGRVGFAYDLNEIVSFYKLYLDLVNYWKKVLPGFIYDVEYENLIKNPKKEIKSLLNFCSLSWNDNCLNYSENKRPIRTASDMQARKKIYKTSINSWKRYEKYLNKFFSSL